MYNGIGLETPRGSGTNGYVQRNLSFIKLSKEKPDYRTENDIKRSEAVLNRPPNQEILEHERLRKVELKCFELRELMTDQAYAEEEIESKVNQYRELLLQQMQGGGPDQLTSEMVDDQGRPVARETHQIAELQQEKNERLKKAFGISDDYVSGSAVRREKPNSEEIGDESRLKKKRANESDMEISSGETVPQKMAKIEEKPEIVKKERHSLKNGKEKHKKDKLEVSKRKKHAGKKSRDKISKKNAKKQKSRHRKKPSVSSSSSDSTSDTDESSSSESDDSDSSSDDEARDSSTTSSSSSSSSSDSSSDDDDASTSSSAANHVSSHKAPSKKKSTNRKENVEKKRENDRSRREREKERDRDFSERYEEVPGRGRGRCFVRRSGSHDRNRDRDHDHHSHGYNLHRK